MTALAAAARRSALWPYALVVFLLHGGILLVGLPILALPSTVGVATFFGPTSVTPAGPAPSLVAFGVAAGALLVAWAVIGGLLAAAAEVLLIRGTAGDAGESRPRLAARVAVARALASFPILLALGWAVPRLGAAAYAELTHPSDPSGALVLRVLGGAPEAVAVLVVAWLVADATGAVAARQVVLRGEGAFAAPWRALTLLVTRPLGVLAASLAGGLAAVALVGGSLLAARTLWLGAVEALDARAGLPAVLLVIAFVGAWALALAAAGLLGTWRALAWTAVALPPPASPAGAWIGHRGEPAGALETEPAGGG